MKATHATLQSMVDLLIYSICYKLDKAQTWAQSGGIYEDACLEKNNRHGMYAFVTADDGVDYGAAVDVSHEQCPTDIVHVARYAGMGTEQLNQVLQKKRECPEINHDESLGGEASGVIPG